MRYLSLLIVGSLVMLAACKKDKDYKNAMVIDTKNISSDGCGYLLLMDDGTFVKPEYLSSAYQDDSLKVKVKIHDDGTVLCGVTPNAAYYPQVVVEDIKRNLD